MLNVRRIIKLPNITKLYANKRHYFYGTVVTAGLISWCSCEGVNQKDNSLSKSWIKDWYEDKVLHSGVVRFGRAGVVLVSVVFDYKFSLLGVDVESERYKSIKSECHLRSAIKFHNVCANNGGVFMKLGQHIGSLEFLFPKEYTDTLKCFQHKAPESSIEDVRYVIESETGCKMTDLFQSFDEKPIGSASLAQVHRAVMKNGGVVAVKVQHKAVKQHSISDAKVIEFFARIASKLFSEFKFQWLNDQIKSSLPKELNFLNEAKNCEDMGRILCNFKYLKVPTIYWQPSTERVLFMEYFDGGLIDDIDYIKKNNLCVEDISRKLGELYSEMIFVTGVIHCDPHAGNILVRRNELNDTTELILLDHGLYQVMDSHVRLHYCKLWQCMIEGDIEGIKEQSTSLGVGDYYRFFACMVTGRSWGTIKAGIDKTSLSAEELKDNQKKAINLVSTITEVLELLPRELIMVFKTNDLLRGLDARLKTKAASASLITMSKCCIRALYMDDLAKCNSTCSRWRLHYRYTMNRLRLLFYQMSLTPLAADCMSVLRQFSSATIGTGFMNILRFLKKLFGGLPLSHIFFDKKPEI